LIILGDLIDHSFNLADIARYLNSDQLAVDSLIESIQASDLTTRLREAEAAYVQRMLIPRFLYFTHLLLIGDVVDCSVALVLPVGSTEDTQGERLTRVDELPRLGPSFVGWHSRSHPYCVLYMRDPRMDDPTRYEMRSVDEMCQEAGVTEACAHPTGAYLLIERDFARLLSPAGTSRPPEAPRGDAPNPRAVAYRLLQFLRQPEDEASHDFGHSFSSIGDGMVYSSPEFMDQMNGDHLLTEITNLVVRLGNAVKTDETPARGSWIFSALLMPENPSLPPPQQSLVVMAQSEESPHTLGVTQLTPGRNEGLSTYAALSGRMMLRRAVESEDPAVADFGVGAEGEPGPALAMPVVSVYGRVLAVLYIRARDDGDTTIDQTFTPDDQLLLRVVGHIIGGIVFSYRGNALQRDQLKAMIERPRPVDRFLYEFKTANAFWNDLDDALKRQMKAGRPPDVTHEIQSPARDYDAPNPITMLVVDISRHTTIINTHGSNTARHLIRAVGRRIAGQPLVTSSSLMGKSAGARNNLYHLYGDRFCLLLENTSMNDGLSYARHLKRLLSSPYELDVSRIENGQSVPVATVTLNDIKVRMALVSYDAGTLRRMLTSAALKEDHEGTEDTPEQRTHDPVQYVISIIMDALNAGLNQGKQMSLDAIMYLDIASGFFRQLTDDDGDAAPPARQAPMSGPLSPNYY
jgi:GGDEF domain-containing protein